MSTRRRLARALIVGGLMLLLLAALGLLVVEGDPLGWVALGLVVALAATLALLGRRGTFRPPQDGAWGRHRLAGA